MMWERENRSLLLQHLSHMQSARGRCSIRSANLGPGLARPQLQRPGPFSLVSSWHPPTVSCYRTCAAGRTSARQWQRRTNVWRKVTSPARGAERLRDGFAKRGGVGARVPAAIPGAAGRWSAWPTVAVVAARGLRLRGHKIAVVLEIHNQRRKAYTVKITETNSVSVRFCAADRSCRLGRHGECRPQGVSTRRRVSLFTVTIFFTAH
jgi:hypothetical protein